MSLLGLIVASVANWFLRSTLLEWVVSFAGVLIFAGLTAYASKTIKEMTSDAVFQGDTLAVQRVGIIGALKLYLDFLNMFLFIMRIVGERRKRLGVGRVVPAQNGISHFTSRSRISS